MQIKSLRVKSYRSWRMDDNTSAEAAGPFEAVGMG